MDIDSAISTLDNPIVDLISVILMITYVTKGNKIVSESFANTFKNPAIKICLFALIIFLCYRDSHIATIMVLLYLITLQLIQNREIEEQFECLRGYIATK